MHPQAVLARSSTGKTIQGDTSRSIASRYLHVREYSPRFFLSHLRELNVATSHRLSVVCECLLIARFAYWFVLKPFQSDAASVRSFYAASQSSRFLSPLPAGLRRYFIESPVCWITELISVSIYIEIVAPYAIWKLRGYWSENKKYIWYIGITGLPWW